MSNNLTRKGLAVSSGLAIALTSLVGVAPAQAASYMELELEDGKVWSVFNHDYVDIDWDEPDTGEYGLALTNTTGQAFGIDGFDFEGAYAVTATGAVFDVYDIIDEDFVVDFDALNAVRVHLTDVTEEDFDIRPLVLEGDGSSWDIDSDYTDATYGEGDFAVGLQIWRETGKTDRDYLTIEANTSSELETLRFFDPARVSVTPRIERYVADDGDWMLPNANGDGYFGWSLSFSKPINLEATDLYYWESLTEFKSGSSWTEAEDGWEQIGEDMTYEYGVYGDSDADDRTRAYLATDFYYDDEDASEEYDFLEGGVSYRVTVAHTDDPGWPEAPNRKFTSAAYEVPVGSDDAAEVELEVGDAANSNQEDDGDIALRPGVKSFTYSAQLLDDEGDALEEADVPVYLVVSASFDNLAALSVGASISTASSATPITRVGNMLIASATTGEDGVASFTITHSSAIASEIYDLQVLYADGDGNILEIDGTEWDYNFTSDYQVEYAAPEVSEIESDSTLAGGTKVTVAFTVTDQFGQVVSKLGTKALSVELTATDTDDLELTAAVDANGRASFTFDNYLEVGGTDLLVAEVFTGTAADPTYVEVSTDVQLYNSPAAASVSVAKNATANVTYKDFVTGAASAAKSASLAADATTYTGTVLDANGAGIPGAVVKVAGTGFLFRSTGVGNYFENSIDVVANETGEFSVDFWTHEANATGKTLTVTSGGKSATTTVKTYLPTGLDGNNLKFELVMPKNVVKNTTYALVAKLTDKWGNPVATSTTDDKLGVTFQGLGSVEINSSSDEVSRNFGKDGTATVYLRSVKDIAGPGSVSAQLNEAAYRATADADLTDLDVSEITTDATSTVWDETKFSNLIEVDVEVLNAAPAAGKVNVGSFNGKLVVYASGLNGSTISWKVGGVWGKAVASSDFARFDRPTPRRGVTVTVDIYVNGVKQLTKSVVTR